ncbi:hypothetical protein [Nocardia brasiliensis]|uniref:hypothetical protein n=1 Tax=Nocardia brasiliensis TaxID=37326 RepID=UPI002453BCDA|nr:hypothetical protein [Nocardia brasiliensis]
MKRGFVSENHTVIYCDLCGDVYAEEGSESICFDSVSQAVAYLEARSPGVGWVYDGDRIWCDGCIAADHCDRNGHQFPDRRPSGKRLRGKTVRDRCCRVCGISEGEVQA